MTISQGDLIDIHYTGRSEDGQVVDSSVGGEPLQFVAGSDHVIPGISESVIGMSVGESKTVKLEPDRAFGGRQEDSLFEVPLEALPDEVAAGDRVSSQQGEEKLVFRVEEVKETVAILDGNHPLAGMTLEFAIEIVAVHTP